MISLDSRAKTIIGAGVRGLGEKVMGERPLHRKDNYGEDPVEEY